jgi:TatD DNase family protein
MLFDTHAHLDDPCFDENRDGLIAAIFESGVTNLINVGTNLETSSKSIKLAEKYTQIYAAVGLHPLDIAETSEADLPKIEKLTLNKKVVAIGEIGLDYHYENFDKERQKYFFKKQLGMAKKLDLPVIIHARDSEEDAYDMVCEAEVTRGVFHCFSGTPEVAQKILNQGFFISFTGVITFKSAKKLENIVKMVPNDRILIETDSPYLSPEPHRGKINDSRNVKFVA